MSISIERAYSKREILETYVNEVFLGQDGNRAVHGFGLAAQFYFGRPLGELGVAEQALLIGIRCERGSHRFFKHYGARFEDSEGKQIFLEFAEEERQHLALLMREYRALRERRHIS